MAQLLWMGNCFLSHCYGFLLIGELKNRLHNIITNLHTWDCVYLTIIIISLYKFGAEDCEFAKLICPVKKEFAAGRIGDVSVQEAGVSSSTLFSIWTKWARLYNVKWGRAAESGEWESQTVCSKILEALSYRSSRFLSCFWDSCSGWSDNVSTIRVHKVRLSAINTHNHNKNNNV